MDKKYYKIQSVITTILLILVICEGIFLLVTMIKGGVPTWFSVWSNYVVEFFFIVAMLNEYCGRLKE